MGKLGDVLQDATAVMVDLAALRVGGGTSNGPEDRLDWDAIKWRDQEAQVQRLRQRIFKAAQAEDWRQVRNLQKLMLRSRANVLVSTLRVTQRNSGRRTPGVDGQVAVTPEARSGLAVLLHRQSGPGTALPVRRVYIVRREALRRIPRAARRNLEGGFWVHRLTRCRKVDGTGACRGGRGLVKAPKGRASGTRVIWQRLHCLKSNLCSVITRTHRKGV
jgi:hypothetical protein